MPQPRATSLFLLTSAVLSFGLLRAEPWPGRWAEKFQQAAWKPIEAGHIPGDVYHIEHQGAASTRAQGWRATTPAMEKMTEDTVFDLASLTKVVATTSSVMKLVEDGKIEIDAPVSRYLPEFTDEGKETVPVRWLLTHNSGLPPGIAYDSANPWSGYEEGIRRACATALRYQPGTDFIYSDINFILLGEIVRRTSGQWISDFAREHFFVPLGMKDTGFTPPEELKPRLAPTEFGGDGQPLRGVVHDPTSRRMGGLTGHAGLFSTAHDLARFCRMLLNKGMLEGRRVLKESTVELMTSTQSPEAVAAKRGLGWDIDSRFSSQRGQFFPAGSSFGHTGWTGTSLWIDPASQTFIIFLSNRNHPTEAGRVGSVRGDLATLAAESVADWQAVSLPGLSVPWPNAPEKMPVAQAAPEPVKTGLDVLRESGFAALKGRRAGLITNHTSLAKDRFLSIDLLAAAPEVTLVALFGPEHGIRGELDRDGIKDSTDEKTGLPVFSLYGERRVPSAEQLAMVDTLIFDIQDIGCRFYTYVSTMALAMEAAAKEGKKFVVLDRPNPIGGEAVTGPLREGKDDFIAAHTIPLRHGMTAGELARMIAHERKLTLDLEIIRCTGWKRGMYYDETNLPWINPSPNMRSLDAAVLYPGIGMLEFTNLSVGRGTDTPFELVGAPWIDEMALAEELNAAGIEGMRVMPVRFTPKASRYEGKECRGIQITVTDRKALNSAHLGAALASALCRRHAAEYETKNLNRLLIHQASLDAIKAGRPWPEISRLWMKDERDFIIRRRPFLLY